MIFNYIIIAVYALALLFIFVYALAQLNLFINYLRAKKRVEVSEKFDFSNTGQIPSVTVQLPVYNEKYVMGRLLDNISKLRYPRAKLEIQVLDDSTDASVTKTAAHISTLQAKGLDIKHITRTARTGFKAGALKEGLLVAKGEYIAIFDADFMPKPDWLLQTVPYFKDAAVGMVQTRWAHINRDYSLLTKIQAFALDFHFILEQVGRNFGGHFINFNGTAGVWRKTCIVDAGNWQGDTLTEDLDLSYRAQLKKWKFKYLEHVETPAELPVVISAAKSQQFRWNKGAAENFRKNYRKLFYSPAVPLGTKFHSFFHLLNSSMFLLVLTVAVLSIPMLYVKANNPEMGWVFHVLAGFAFSTAIFFLCYWLSYSRTHGG
ncbi:MAG: cellulose synthase family protein, partial [Marinirhabdus sp.]